MRLKSKYVILLILFLIPYMTGQSIDRQTVKQKYLNVRTTEVIRAKIGSGPDDLGAISPPEAASFGPMSFTVSPGGEIYVLDQINSRIQVFRDKKKIRTIKIPVPSAGLSDIELLPDGKIAMLDNINEESLFIIDNQGKLINKIPLVSQLIAYAPEATAINAVKEGRFTGVWVSVNGSSVRLADAEGKSVMRVSVPGWLTSDSERLLDAEILGEATVLLRRSEKGSLSMWDPELTVNFDMFVVHLAGPWSDINGNIYLSAFLEDSEGEGKTSYSDIMVIFSAELKETGRIRLALQKSSYEIFHPLKVSNDGKIYQMIAEEKEIAVLRYEF